MSAPTMADLRALAARCKAGDPEALVEYPDAAREALESVNSMEGDEDLRARERRALREAILILNEEILASADSGQQTLLPCHFCGTSKRDDDGHSHSAVLRLEHIAGAFRVECRNCARSFDAPDDAIAAWNRRHPGDGFRSGEITLNEARAARGLPAEDEPAVLLPLDLLPCADVLVANISGEEMAQTGSLIERALHGPEEGRLEALGELMRYTRQVLDIPEPETAC